MGNKMNFKNLLSGYSEYSDFCAAIKKGKIPVSIAGLAEPCVPQFIFQAHEDKKTLVITYSDLEAKRLLSELGFYTDKAVLFPQKEYIFHNIDAKDHNIEHQRLCALLSISNSSIVVTSLEAMLQFTLSFDTLSKYTIDFKQDQEYDTDDLAKMLVDMGYTREDEVVGRGQFALRGGILDIFSPQMENPVRIEFFDTQIDSIREFDSMSQRSVGTVNECRIIPCTELAGQDTNQLITKLQDEIKKLARKKSNQEKLIDNIRSDIEALKNGELFSIYKYIEFIFDKIPTILDYFDENSRIFLIEPRRIAERSSTFSFEQAEIIRDLDEKSLIIPKHTAFWEKYENLKEVIQKLPLISINTLTHSAVDYTYKSIFNFNTKTTVSLHGKFEYLFDNLKEGHKKGSTIVILAQNRSRGENLAGTLNEKGIKCRYIHDNPEFEKGEVVIVRGELGKGFEYPDIDFVLFSDRDIFDTGRKKSRRKIENAKRLKSYTDINVGDYVVHRAHGIGKYCGIKKMEVEGTKKD